MNEKEQALEQFNLVLEIDPGNIEASRFLKGIRTLKTYEIMPLGFRWNVYPDGSFSVTAASLFTYHMKQSWDFSFQYENACIQGIHDHTTTFETVFKGLKNTYIRGGFGYTPQPEFSPNWNTDLGLNYSFPRLFGTGISIQTDIYENETLLKLIPEIRKDFTEVSYISLKYNHYMYTTGYSTGSFEIMLNVDYYNGNDLFVKAIYGGDIEVRDKTRRVFDIATGISINITDNLETLLTYGRIETPYGKSHEISYQSVIKW